MMIKIMIMIIIKIKITDKQTKITRIKIMMVKTYNHLHVDDVRCLVVRGLQGGGSQTLIL